MLGIFVSELLLGKEVVCLRGVTSTTMFRIKKTSLFFPRAVTSINRVLAVLSNSDPTLRRRRFFPPVSFMERELFFRETNDGLSNPIRLL